jgi:methyl-accepting chemotaxis protein
LDGAAFEKLSKSFQRLNDTAMYLGDLADMSKASKDFTHNTKDAAIALGSIKDAVGSVSNNLGSFASATDGVKNLNEQFAMMSKSMEAMNTYYAKLTEASNAMSSSAQDAIRAKEQIALLADNLTQLNKVYGNMIIAMQGR